MQEAVEDFTSAIEFNPSVAEYYYHRGTVYIDLKDYNNALNDYNQALILNSNYAEVYKNRSFLYFSIGQYEKALDDSNMLIELTNGDSSAYSGRGLIYARLQRYQDALNDFAFSINLDSNNLAAYFNRGGIFYELQRYPEALVDFNFIINKNPRYNSEIYLVLGNIYYWQLNYQMAILNYTKAIQISPQNAAAYLNRASVYQILAEQTQDISILNEYQQKAQSDRSSFERIRQNLEILEEDLPPSYFYPDLPGVLSD